MIPRAMLVVAYANGKASHARQVNGDDPDKKGYAGPPGWGLGVRLTTPPLKSIVMRSQNKRVSQGPHRALEPMLLLLLLLVMMIMTMMMIQT